MSEPRNTPITLILAYYDNPGMLQMQYDDIRALPTYLRDGLHMIVVDDGSPRWPAFATDLGGVPLQIYRMAQDIRWNQDAARNVGVHHSETEFVLLTDMDHRVPAKTWETMRTRQWDKKVAYQFRRVSMPEMEGYKPHPNSWFMSRTLYNACGGYDERFAGYYGTDGDFAERVRGIATDVRQVKESIIRVPRTLVPDASTTTYLRKQPEDREAILRIKGERKADPHWKPITLSQKYDRVFP